jgi:hypothetical protein
MRDWFCFVTPPWHAVRMSISKVVSLLCKHTCEASDGSCSGWPQEDMSESRPVHATFKDSVEQLAGASEDYKREAVNFLRSLLHPNPAMRMTADGALRHPFLTKTFSDVDPYSMPPEITEEIKLETTWERMLCDRVKAVCEEEVGKMVEGEDGDKVDDARMTALVAQVCSPNPAG